MRTNERSLDDQPVTNPRRRRRRLGAHALGFSVAGLVCLSVGTTSTSAAPTVQPGRYLEAGSLNVVYTCVGDAATQPLLNLIGLPSFTLDVTITSVAVEPSPSPTEDFDMEFIWDFTLSPDLVLVAIDNSAESLDIGSNNTIGVVSGATGADSVGAGAGSVLMGDGSVPVGYTHGPFTATYNRTAAVDEPIEFAPGVVTSTVVTQPGGIGLGIVCNPNGESTLIVNDQDGVAPTTTTTTRPTVVPTTVGVTPTTVSVGGVSAGELPRTGSSSNLYLVLLAVGLLDVGYLALTAGRPARLGRTPSVR